MALEIHVQAGEAFGEVELIRRAFAQGVEAKCLRVRRSGGQKHRVILVIVPDLQASKEPSVSCRETPRGAMDDRPWLCCRYRSIAS